MNIEAFMFENKCAVDDMNMKQHVCWVYFFLASAVKGLESPDQKARQYLIGLQRFVLHVKIPYFNSKVVTSH